MEAGLSTRYSHHPRAIILAQSMWQHYLSTLALRLCGVRLLRLRLRCALRLLVGAPRAAALRPTAVAVRACPSVSKLNKGG